MPQSAGLGQLLQIVSILHRFFVRVFPSSRIAAERIRQNQRSNLILRAVGPGKTKFLLLFLFLHCITPTDIVSLQSVIPYGMI